jgi:RNA polymerase sigma-70 factor (ECF subfamily)
MSYRPKWSEPDPPDNDDGGEIVRRAMLRAANPHESQAVLAKPVTLRVVPRIVSPSPPERDRDEEGGEDLHAAIQSGAPGWQKRAFDEFHGLVHGLLVKCLGPNAEILDLVSEVFLTFFENAQRIRDPNAVRSYLVSITMNKARRQIRTRRRRAFFQGLTGTTAEIEHRPGPDDPKAKAALIHLDRILGELGADARAAFVLHSLEGMEITEIANVIGVSLSTAKRRVKQANEHVRKRVSRNALLSDYIREKTVRRRA